MQPTVILYPVIVQVLLTLAVLVAMGPARARSLSESGKSMNDPDVRLGHMSWSETATKIGNNFKNQFELPVLFYAVVAFALQTRAVDVPMVTLAWVFAVSRIAHSLIHIGPNVLAWRGAAYLVGLIALVAMWARLTLHIL